MTTSQGWDLATYKCARCGGAPVFTASTEAQYVTAYRLHQETHDVMDGLTPEQASAILVEVGYDPLSE